MPLFLETEIKCRCAGQPLTLIELTPILWEPDGRGYGRIVRGRPTYRTLDGCRVEPLGDGRLLIPARRPRPERIVERVGLAA